MIERTVHVSGGPGQDWRYGTDNIRVAVDYSGVPAADAWRPRVWCTDLHTGRTETAANDRVWLPSGTMFYGDRSGSILVATRRAVTSDTCPSASTHGHR